MPFLPPNQQRQSTEGVLNTNLHFWQHGAAVTCTDVGHWLCVVEGDVSEVEQTLGSLAMEAVTLLLTANNSNAGQYLQSSSFLAIYISPPYCGPRCLLQML